MSENIESDKTLIIPPLASLSLARLVSGERQATRQGIEMQLSHCGLRRRQRQRQNIANGP